MNIESTILYNDVATLAIIAGTEYWTNSFLTGNVPSVVGELLTCSAIFMYA